MAEPFNLFAGLEDEEDEQEQSSSNSLTATQQTTNLPTEDTFNLFAGLEDEEEVAVEEAEVEQPFNLFAGLDEPDTAPTQAEDPTEYDLDVEKTFDEFAADQGYIDSIKEYAVSRYGAEQAAELDDKSNDEILELFLTEVRAFETNSLNLMSMLDYARGASEEDKQNFGFIYSQLDKMPGFLSEGGGSTASGLLDYVGSFITDPINLVGFGAGRVAASGAKAAILQTFKQKGKEAAIKEAGKLSLQAAKKPLAVEAGFDLTAGTIEDLGRQTIEAEVGMTDDVSVGRAMLVGGLQAVAGGIITVGGTAATARSGAKSIIKESEDAIKEVAELVTKKEVDEITKLADDGYVYDPINGREILEEIDLKSGKTARGATLTEPQLQTELTDRMAKIATEVVQDMVDAGGGRLPKALTDRINAETKASEVARIVLSSEDIDTTVLDAAVKRAGLSMSDFLDVSGVTLSDASQTMRAYSPLGKILKRVRELDPKKAEEIEEIFGKEGQVGNSYGKMHDFMMRLDRERRAFMVSQIATTARNVATAGMRLGMEGTARTMESALYHLGKGVGAISRGDASVEGTVKGLRQIAYDGFGTLQYLTNAGGSKELADALLVNTPRLHRIMNRTLQEVDVEQRLSRPARIVNTLNMLQDSYFRSAVFNDSVERQLSAVGVDIAEFALSGKALPTKVAERAVDDALSFTFARMPKKGGTKTGDTLGHYFVKINETLGPLPGVVGIPAGTGAFPFGRFMVNAMQFQFDYSPLSTIGAIRSGGKGLYAKYVKGASKAETAADFAKARQQISKATVGTAALFAAIKHREENQDTEWYNLIDNEGRTIDTRAFFPISPYLVVADFIVKMKNDELDEAGIKQVMEGLTGAQLRSGASSYMIDSFFENLSDVTGGGTDIKAEKFAEYVGGYLGELVGSFTTPLKVVNDVVAQFDADAAIVRDAKQIEGTGAAERGVDAFEKAAFRGVPFLNQRLPEKESPSQTEPMRFQSPLLGQFTGVRPQARRTDVQKELTDLGYADYEIVPSTGDKAADAFVKRAMGKFVEESLAREIAAPSYQRLSTSKKKAAMRNKLKRYRDIAKKVGQAEASRASRKEGKAFTPFDRAQWSKLSTGARKLADEYYMERYGMTVMEKQEEEPNRNHFLTGKKIGQQLNRVMK